MKYSHRYPIFNAKNQLIRNHSGMPSMHVLDSASLFIFFFRVESLLYSRLLSVFLCAIIILLPFAAHVQAPGGLRDRARDQPAVGPIRRRSQGES